MLSVRDLTVRYGRTPAVQNLSLEVGEGEIVGLVGPNGAGKSTTLAAIVGLVPVAEGDINYLGESLVGLAPEDDRAARHRPGARGPPHLRTLTVGENLVLGRTANPRSQSIGRRRSKHVLDRFPILRKTFRLPAGTLSGGEQQQLAIARALIAEPRLLLLDEPSLGLAPRLVDQVFEALAEIRRGRGNGAARRAERQADGRARGPDLRRPIRPDHALGPRERSSPAAASSTRPTLASESARWLRSAR